jgi:hypothetical protein
MNLRNNSIFYKKEDEANKIYIYKNKYWTFVINGKEYSMNPAGVVSMSLSPMVKGANDLIESTLKYQIIKNPENGFYLIYSNEETLNYDIKFELDKSHHNGWIYDVKFKKIKTDVSLKVYACDYLRLFYSDAPKFVYVTIE